MALLRHARGAGLRGHHHAQAGGKELFQSRKTLRRILDNIPRRVFWKDRDLVYLGCNRALALVELTGGTLGVESVVGKGSTFWIELPPAVTPGLRDEAEARLFSGGSFSEP